MLFPIINSVAKPSPKILQRNFPCFMCDEKMTLWKGKV